MYRFVLAKFKGNQDAKQRLVDAALTYLAEESQMHDLWSIGKLKATGRYPTSPAWDWGKNHLGLILMTVRNQLRQRFEQAQQQQLRPSFRYTKTPNA